MPTENNKPTKPHWRPNLVLWGLWSRFDVVKELAWDMERSVRRKIKDLEAQASQLDELEDEDHRDYLSDSLADEYHSYVNEWNPLIRESLLLSICSSFEYHLGQLCSTYGRDCGSSFKMQDMKDRGIQRCRKYLTRLGVEESAFGSAWTALADVYAVRNRIAHAGSISDNRTENAIKTQNDIFEQHDDQSCSIKIQENGIEKVCDLMQKTLHKLNQNLYAPSRQQQRPNKAQQADS